VSVALNHIFLTNFLREVLYRATTIGRDRQSWVLVPD